MDTGRAEPEVVPDVKNQKNVHRKKDPRIRFKRSDVDQTITTNAAELLSEAVTADYNVK